MQIARRTLIIAATGLLLASAGVIAADRNAALAQQLTGNWKLEPSASDDPQAKLVEAIATRKKPRRPRREPAIDEVFIPDEPVDPRRETEIWQNELATPPQLSINASGSDIRIGANERDLRSFSPGQPYARVDTRGTAKISSSWKSGSFEVRERYQRYDRGGSRTETYALDKTGRLVFTRVVQMPMFGSITIRSVYSRI
ncbi:MAG: hypothetical protein ABIT36_11985 [Steroidobacteraceae bacterium]